MPNTMLEDVKKKISDQHEGDVAQLSVIFSDSPRVIVEAPAGFGKTATMISRIAYLIASDRVPNPKRILTLTFSVNAALKAKREIAGKLPALVGTHNSPVAVGEKATVTNYHGFCKGILKKYGYLLSSSLRNDIYQFQAFGESEIEKLKDPRIALTLSEIACLKEMDSTIKKSLLPSQQAIQFYNDIIIQKLLPIGLITHNAVILLVLQMFRDYEEVRKFYQNYYTLIVVDEFQDTNIIAWSLLESIISDNTQLLFLGDPLQRIYGFIGALSNIMSMAVDKYSMDKVELLRNYRFRNNPEMLKLDKNIRANASACFSPIIEPDSVAKLQGFWGSSQKNEAEQIAEKIQRIITDGTSKVAVLFRSRGKNAEALEEVLSNKQIPYFYGMFTDEDVQYVRFHQQCQSLFLNRFEKQKAINKKTLSAFVDSVKEKHSKNNEKTIKSLLRLLDALVQKVSIDYADLLPEEKYMLLLDIFENRQLKQAMEYVDSQIILATIHGAKGLEWDYVIICDVERMNMPGYYTCIECSNFSNGCSCNPCSLPKQLSGTFLESVLDELSVFYVGVTRAKKQVYVSASAKQFDRFGNDKDCVFSCLAGLAGIKLIKAQND